MINPLTMTPCTFTEFVDYLSKCSDVEQEEIEKLLGHSNINYLENNTDISSFAINPTTLEQMSKEDIENAKKLGMTFPDKLISVVFIFAGKYKYGNDMDALESINIMARGIYPKDDNKYYSYEERPFESCFVLTGVPKKCIDDLPEEAKAFLTNFSVIEFSASIYDCYDIVVFFNHKDPEGVPYIEHLWFHS